MSDMRERWRNFLAPGRKAIIEASNERREAWRPVAEATKARLGHGDHEGWQLRAEDRLVAPMPGTWPLTLWCGNCELLSADPRSLPIPGNTP